MFKTKNAAFRSQSVFIPKKCWNLAKKCVPAKTNVQILHEKMCEKLCKLQRKKNLNDIYFGEKSSVVAVKI